MIKFKLLALECLLKWLKIIYSAPSSQLVKGSNLGLLWYVSYHVPHPHSFATPPHNTCPPQQGTACPPPASHPLQSPIRTISHALGHHTTCALPGSDIIVCCSPLFTWLQPSWCSFCFLRTSQRLLISQPLFSLFPSGIACPKLAYWWHVCTIQDSVDKSPHWEVFPDQPA